MDASKPPEESAISTNKSAQDQSALSTHDTSPEAQTYLGELTPADFSPNKAQPSAKAGEPSAIAVTQPWKPRSIASLLLSLPPELRLDILTRVVYRETSIQLPHDEKAGKCKACKKEWDEYKDEVLSAYQVFHGEQDQLYDEAFHIFLRINTFSIECAGGSQFLRKLLSEFILDADNKEPTTGMSLIQRVEIERLDSSAWPIHHRFLSSTHHLFHLTIVLNTHKAVPRFRDFALSSGLGLPLFTQALTRLTSVVLDVSDIKKFRLSPMLDSWHMGRYRAKWVLEEFIPAAREWFRKRKGENFKLVVQMLSIFLQKVDVQVLPRVQVTNELCDKFDLPHSIAAEFNQIKRRRLH